VWYGYNQRPALTLFHLIASGSWRDAHKLACSELLPPLALATIPTGSLLTPSGSSSNNSSGKGRSSGSSVAGQVLSVLQDMQEAAAAFLATVGEQEAAAAAEQVGAGGWEGPEEWGAGQDEGGSNGSNGGGNGSNGGSSARMQAYCVAAAAYVATAIQTAAGQAAEQEEDGAAAAGGSVTSVAGVTLHALCDVFGAHEGSLGSAWGLGAGVYAAWSRAFLNPTDGCFTDPATAAAAAGGDECGDGEEEGGDGGVQRLQQSLRGCLLLADLLADAAAAVRVSGGRDSWWGASLSQLVLSSMTSTVGRALVRLGVVGGRGAGAGAGARVAQQQQQQGVKGGSGSGRGLLLAGSQSRAQMLAAAAVASVVAGA